MRFRSWLTVLVLVVITLGISTAVPAQAQAPTRKVFEVLMTSFKFEPNQLRFNEGDTVVIRLRNVDPTPGQGHSLAARYLMDLRVTIRGESQDYRTGTFEGLRWFNVVQGKQAEIEFVAQGRGSYAFLCGVTDHAWRGQTGAFFVLPAGAP